MNRIYLLLAAIIGFSTMLRAQSNLGVLDGKVTDGLTKKPVEFATVTIEGGGGTKKSKFTDKDGEFEFTAIPAGQYTISVSFIGYQKAILEDITVRGDNKITSRNIVLSNAVGPTIVVRDKQQLIDKDDPSQNNFSKLQNKPTQNINAIAGISRGVDSRGGTPNIRGARAENTAYYIDGVRVTGINLPANAIENLEVITGGTPASYGDFTGGAISATTKAPTKQWVRFIEFRSASPFYGYLDNSHANEFTSFVSGPILLRDKGNRDREKVLVGFTNSIRGSYALDGGLSAVDIYKVKDTKMREIEANPVRPNALGTLVPAGEFLTKGDLEKLDNRQNASGYSVNTSGNFNYQPNNNINVKLGYQALFFSQNNWNSYNSLLNSANNSQSQGYRSLVYLQFTQMFNKKEDTARARIENSLTKGAKISDAYYTIRVSYERNFTETFDPTHGKEFFNYGYVGTFKTFNAPSYTTVRKGFQQNPDTINLVNGEKMYLTGYVRQTGFRDSAFTFTKANFNPLRGNYTQAFLNYYGGERNFNNFNFLRGLGALQNGDDPISIYSGMWGNLGDVQSGYSKNLFENYIVYLESNATVAPRRNLKAKHNLQFGLTYEQRIQRNYSLGASALWQLMPLLANRQFAGLDTIGFAKFDANGVFQDTITFNRRVNNADQTEFDKNLRSKLMQEGKTDNNGNPITGQTFLDVNSYSPGTYNLNMFSANELLNNGNSFVGYSGYDHLGNTVSGKPGINEFFKNRILPAYQPIYFAAWMQDKFQFKDLILRVGVRVERFDANQLVLRDPYSMVPILTAGEIRAAGANTLKIQSDQIASAVKDDWKVYINTDNFDAQSYGVAGYRDGNKWYDKNGNPVSDPAAIQRAVGTSQNVPYVQDPKNPKTPTEQSFKDYEPDLQVLPRIWFSFPISTSSQFYGTYDILTQRPGSNVAQIDDYFYLSNRLTGIIANPDLKMTQVTDYEIGFRQQIGKNSAIGIIASYRENRNQTQLFNFIQAWPNTYTTIGNIDFSTVKSVGLEYKLIELGNLNIDANYNLQFADGTGSNTGSSSALIQAGLPNNRTIFPLDFDTRHTFKTSFDFHYKDGKKYDGPIVSGKKIFENAGFNFIFSAYSGRPFTQDLISTPSGVQSGAATRSPIKGSPNGANLPAQFNVDLNVDKNFTIKNEKAGARVKEYRMRVFLTVTNLLNAANVTGVFRYTGSAYNDGYLSSPFAADQIRTATNAQSFVDLYNTRMVNPDRFLLPRLTRIGFSVQF
ncbi:MAG: carboxypeptidase regulatory-like domain-containing protein [Bacteroidota bacterium]